MRPVVHRYLDPLDQVWLTTATRVGLRVERASDVYASTDGRGTLRIGTDQTLDADDSLAQMIFHELCHALVEGPESFRRPDWGLENIDDRHVHREHACLRVQATLSAEYGLRRFFAPTTDFRSFYDALPANALQPRHDPTVTAAVLGLGRVDTSPWAPHLREALHATATIAREAARFAPTDGNARRPVDSDQRPSLWERIDPLPERHPTGLVRADDGDPERRCGTCAWRYQGGPGRVTDRCRQATGARVEPAWLACTRWEPALDCLDCGACCRAAYDSVTVSRREPVIRRHPALVVDRGSYVELVRVPDPAAPAGGSQCAALAGGSYDTDTNTFERYHCVIYDDRPRPCRDFELGGAHCLTARRRVGLSR